MSLTFQVFAVLFFLMLITLGLGSAVGFMSAITTTIFDSFPRVNKEHCMKYYLEYGVYAGYWFNNTLIKIKITMIANIGKCANFSSVTL